MKPLFLCLFLVSCAEDKIVPVFSGVPSHPKTEIKLGEDLLLTHYARRDAGGEAGASVDWQNCSEWRMTRVDGRVLLRVPSSLTNPSYAGEFEDNYRKYDKVEVHRSKTGGTFVIVEDRSPSYPSCDYLLLRKKEGGAWEAKKLDIEPYLRPAGKGVGSTDFQGALSYNFPRIVEVTDTSVSHTGRDGIVRRPVGGLSD